MAKVRLSDKTLRRPLPATGQVELWDDLVPGFGLRIAAGGARTYFVMKRLNGKLVRRTVGKVAPPDGALAPGELALSDARERARGLLSDLARGLDPDQRPKAVEPTAKTPDTFGEVAKAYFKDPAKRGGFALKSKGELERKVRVDLAAWDARPIGEITRADIRAVLNAKHAKSPVSANRLLALVRRIFRWAVREELIGANPAMDIEPTPEQERERVLKPSELAQIWAGAEALGFPYGPIVQLLILTVQRRGEVAGMTWSEIEGSAWTLLDSRVKRGKGHMVPLSPRAVEILKGLPRIGNPPTFLFTTGGRRTKATDTEAVAVPVSGWSDMKEDLDTLIAKAAAEEAGEPLDLARHALPHWTLHDLRRTASTLLRDSDFMGEDRVDRLTLSKILNHAEGGVTRLYDRYSADPEQRRALEAWAKQIERLCGLNVVSLDGARA